MNNLQRPDGSVVSPIGWILIVVGVLGALIAASADTLTGMLSGFAMANLGFGLGVLLLSLGYLVRAIWFLPGREITAAELHERGIQSGTTVRCDWCDRNLPAHFRTCTSFDHEALSKVSEKVVDPVCKDQLRQRGYAVAGPE